jgi:hypothetical protein
MEDLLLKNITDLIASISFVIGIVFFIVAAFEKNSFRINLKIAGAFLVASISFFVNNAGIHALAIFIIATFITKLDFLENLAAIFWGRKEFWDYRKSTLSPASDDEIEKKTTDVTNDNEDNLNPHQFEIQALNDLERSEIFKEPIQKNVKLEIEQSEVKRKVIFDGLVVLSSSISVIIEVKTNFNLNANHALITSRIDYLNTHYLNKHTKRTVLGIIILPSDQADGNFIATNAAVLRYNYQTRSFDNGDIIKEWIESSTK